MSDYYERQRRRRRQKEEEDRKKKKAAKRRAEEHRLRDLQGEGLFDFIKKHMPGLPATTDARRMTPLTLIGYMLKYGRDLRADDNFLARWAAANDDLPLLKTLRAHGADLSVYADYIPRHFAKRGNLEALLWIRDQGIPVKPQLETLMYAAAEHHDRARMETLLRADPTLNIQQNHAINRAAKSGNLSVLTWYAQRGAIFHADECSYNALLGGHIPVLDFLEKRGVKIEYGVEKGAPKAAFEGHLPVFEWLHTRNIPVDLNDCARWAAHGRHTALVRFLYERGARLNDRTEASIIFNAEADGHTDLQDFFMAQRNARNAHYVTEAFNAALSDSRAPQKQSAFQKLRNALKF